MTTYLLHGGMTSKLRPENDWFFTQFTHLVKKDEVTVLLCYFSRVRSTWDALVERDTAKIQAHSQKRVNILVADNPKDLFSKLKRSDVLYVAGGEAEPLESLYPELKDLKIHLEDKVYAGSSMGAFLASHSYVLSLDDQADREVHTGLGLLPFQILCHWNVEEKKDLKLSLLRANSPLPILVLNDFETITCYF